MDFRQKASRAIFLAAIEEYVTFAGGQSNKANQHDSLASQRLIAFALQTGFISRDELYQALSEALKRQADIPFKPKGVPGYLNGIIDGLSCWDTHPMADPRKRLRQA